MSRFLNEAIDKALTDPPKQLLDDLQPLVRLQETEALADRVRRRATALVRSGRAHADTIMSTRDQIILTLYHAASPQGWFSGWCDGSIVQYDGRRGAGIGGVLMGPGGNMVAQYRHDSDRPDAFEAEIDALVSLLETSLTHGAKRIRVHSDCKALVQRWTKKRDDHRLQQVRAILEHYVSFDLRAVPPRHNRPAHRLAHSAAIRALPRSAEVGSASRRDHT